MDFGYHRAIAPLMWAIVALGAAELAIVHLLVSLWNLTVALVLSGFTLASIVWLVLLIRSLKRLPVRIEGERLILRSGSLVELETLLVKVAGVRAYWDSAALKAPDLLNLALIAYPNVIVDFVDPVPHRRKAIRAVAHRLDDSAAFMRALGALIGGHDGRR